VDQGATVAVLADRGGAALRDTVRRWLYRHRHASRIARFLNAAQAQLAAAGIGPRWLIVVEVTGRRTGKTISFPAGARAHIPVDPGAPMEAFERIAAQYPAGQALRASLATLPACPKGSERPLHRYTRCPFANAPPIWSRA